MKLFLREKLAIWLLLTWGFCGCVHSKVAQHDFAAEVKAIASEQHDNTEQSHAAAEAKETVTKAPTEVKSSSEREQLGVVLQDAKGGITIARVPKDKPLRLAPGAHVVGTVPLDRTTSERDAKTGAVKDEKELKATTERAAEAKGASTSAVAAKVKADDKVTTSMNWWPPWWAVALLVGGLAGAGVAVWKLKPAWLGWLWKLLKVAT